MKKSIVIVIFSCLYLVSFTQPLIKVTGTGVGIGSSSPDAMLHIKDNTAVLRIKKSSWVSPNSTKTVDITSNTGSIRVGAIRPNSNQFLGAAFQAFSNSNPAFPGQFYFDAGTNASSGLFFRTNAGATTAMQINKAGNVGIGTAPSAKLHVKGNIIYTGTLTPSDARLKSNVSNLKLGLAQVLMLNPMTYSYNGKGGTIENDLKIGLLAQELQKIAPSLVEEYTHTEMTNSTLEEGPRVINQEKYLSIKDNEIKYLLINAIKEQQKIINALEKRLSKLEK